MALGDVEEVAAAAAGLVAGGGRAGAGYAGGSDGGSRGEQPLWGARSRPRP